MLGQQQQISATFALAVAASERLASERRIYNRNWTIGKVWVQAVLFEQLRKQSVPSCR